MPKGTMKAILLLLLAPILMVPAYADTVEIDTGFVIDFEDCTKYFASQNSAIQMLTCTWGNAEFVESEQQFTLVPFEAPQPDKICADALVWNEVTDQCDEIYQEQVKIKLTPFEKEVEAIAGEISWLQGKHNLSVSEGIILEIYENIAPEVCPRGISDAEAYQQRDDIIIPEEWIKEIDGQYRISIPGFDPKQSLDFRPGTPLGNMALNAQECKHNMEYIFGFGGIPNHYKNKVQTEDDFQLDHRDAIPVVSQPNWTDTQDSTTEFQEIRAVNKACLLPQFDLDLKKTWGCPQADFNDDKPLPNSDKFIQTYALPLDKWNKNDLVCGLYDTDHIIDDRVIAQLELWRDEANCSSANRVQNILLLEDAYEINKFLREMESKK